jgi:hypothetical protein
MPLPSLCDLQNLAGNNAMNHENKRFMLRLKELYVEYLRLLILHFLSFTSPWYFFWKIPVVTSQWERRCSFMKIWFLRLFISYYTNLLKSRVYYPYERLIPNTMRFSCTIYVCVCVLQYSCSKHRFLISSFHRPIFQRKHTVLSFEMRNKSFYLMQINLVFKGLIFNENSYMKNLSFHPLIFKPHSVRKTLEWKRSGAKLSGVVNNSLKIIRLKPTALGWT